MVSLRQIVFGLVVAWPVQQSATPLARALHLGEAVRGAWPIELLRVLVVMAAARIVIVLGAAHWFGRLELIEPMDALAGAPMMTGPKTQIEIIGAVVQVVVVIVRVGVAVEVDVHVLVELVACVKVALNLMMLAVLVQLRAVRRWQMPVQRVGVVTAEPIMAVVVRVGSCCAMVEVAIVVCMVLVTVMMMREAEVET